MPDRREQLENLVRRFESERDELKVKIGLAKLEAREEWQELEKKIETLRGRLKVVREEARDASGDVSTAFGVLADEIKDGFARIRRLL